MKKMELGNSGILASRIALGCMRMEALTPPEAAKVIDTAVEAGINFFDHADIYGGGKSEEVFAAGLKQSGVARDQIILQSKCGIRKGYYDFSKKYILESVEGILRRLETDYLDVLVLHRPDALMEPEEVAEAFNALQESGKVRAFGVSNQNPMQMELLSSVLQQRLIVNQLQFSPVHTGMIDCGMQVNMKTDGAVQRDGMVLDYCRLKKITIQAWSPFQYGMIEGAFFRNPAFSDVTAVIQRMADEKGITDSAVVTAWILRHPAQMQMIAGTMNPQRIQAIAQAEDHPLTREEWYEIYRANGNIIP